MASDPERTTPEADARAAQRPKVLVLDDHPAVRLVVERVIRAQGYEPVNAGSVTEAAEVLARTAVSAVVLDVRLPGGESGLTLLAQMRENPRLAPIPTIVMTGASLSEAQQLDIAHHGAYLLRKPEGLTALAGFLNRLIETGSSAP